VIGEALISKGLLTKANLEYALELQKKEHHYLGYILAKHNLINLKLFQDFLRKNPTPEEINLLEKGISKETIKKINLNIAWFYHAAPLSENEDHIIIGFPYLPDEPLLSSLTQIASKKIKPLLCSKKTIYRSLTRYFPLEADKGTYLPIDLEIGTFVILNDDEKIIPKNIKNLKMQDTASEWLRSILADAIKNKAKKIILLKKENQPLIEYDKQDRPILPISNSVYVRLQRLLSALGYLLPSLKTQQRGFVLLQINNKFFYLIITSNPDIQGAVFKLEFFDEKILRTDYSYIENNFPKAIELIEKFMESSNGILALVSSSGVEHSYFFYPIIDCLKNKYKCMLIEDMITYPLRNVKQISSSSLDEIQLDQILNNVIQEHYDIIALAPVIQKKFMEIAFLLSAKQKIITLSHAYDGAKFLEWLIKMGFLSAMKVGILKGIIFYRYISKICPSCKIKFPMDNYIPMEQFTSQDFFTNNGCSICKDPLWSEKQLLVESIPLDNNLILALQENQTAELIRLALTNMGIELINKKALLLASKGILDSREVLSLLI
jgi:type IV pilus assembly protein PilB